MIDSEPHPKGPGMSIKSQHVAPNPSGGWSVRRSGSIRASRVFETREAAVRYARDKAKKERTDLYLHGVDGMVREKSSYGSDRPTE